MIIFPAHFPIRVSDSVINVSDYWYCCTSSMMIMEWPNRPANSPALKINLLHFKSWLNLKSLCLFFLCCAIFLLLSHNITILIMWRRILWPVLRSNNILEPSRYKYSVVTVLHWETSKLLFRLCTVILLSTPSLAVLLHWIHSFFYKKLIDSSLITPGRIWNRSLHMLVKVTSPHQCIYTSLDCYCWVEVIIQIREHNSNFFKNLS